MLQCKEMLDLKHTIMYRLFEEHQYPFEVLNSLKDEIVKIGKTLTEDYKEIIKNVWIHKTAKIDSNSKIISPSIIGKNAEVRFGAFIRGGAVIGDDCVIGNSCEIKNSIIFDSVQIPHFNYVGDSIIGYKSHLGAGVIISNLRLDKENIVIKGPNFVCDTSLRKFGAIIGDAVEVGCNSVINPGTIILKGSIIYPLSSVSGVVMKKVYKGDEI